MFRGTNGIENFALKRKHGKSFATQAKPSTSILAEIQRLQFLHKKTKANASREKLGSNHFENSSGDDTLYEKKMKPQLSRVLLRKLPVKNPRSSAFLARVLFLTRFLFSFSPVGTVNDEPLANSAPLMI